MRSLKLLLLFTICSISLAGCATNRVTNDIVAVHEESPTLQSKIDKNESSYNDDFEDLNPYAYNHYVMALLLESEDPPDIAAAAEHYKIALQSYPNSYELRYSLAKSYMSMKKFPQTLELLSIIQPVDRKVLMMRGMSFLQVNKQNSAKFTYEQLAKLDPNEPISYHYLKGFYQFSNNTDSLIWCYENLTRLLSFNEKYWQELGKLKALKGEYKVAKTSFQKSLERNNTSSNMISYIGLAEMYKLEKQYDSVLITYNNALLVDTMNAALYSEISLLYAQLDSLEQAIPYAQKAVQYNPQDVQSRRRLGIIYYGTQKFDSAETVFTELVNKSEKNHLNHFYLGRIAIQRKEYKIAVDEFKIMVQLNATTAQHWMDLGYAYKMNGDLPHEILSYKTGLQKIKNKNDQIRFMFSLGAAYEQGKMIDSAIVTFENIISQDKNNHQAINYLGYMLVENNRQLKYAEKLIKKAVKLDKNNAAYLDSYGWLFYKLQKYKKAITYLKKAALLREDAVIFEHLGDAYNAKGEKENAFEWWNKALEINPDNKVLQTKLQ